MKCLEKTNGSVVLPRLLVSLALPGVFATGAQNLDLNDQTLSICYKKLVEKTVSTGFLKYDFMVRIRVSDTCGKNIRQGGIIRYLSFSLLTVFLIRSLLNQFDFECSRKRSIRSI